MSVRVEGIGVKKVSLPGEAPLYKLKLNVPGMTVAVTITFQVPSVFMPVTCTLSVGAGLVRVLYPVFGYRHFLFHNCFQRRPKLCIVDWTRQKLKNLMSP